jgi:serine/threonine-protein kinase
VLAGKYRVERTLGRGGMGFVVAARHVQLGELVALKFLLPEMAREPEIVERFAREARAAARIKSEHVARVSDVGTLDGGAPYMVMEYLDGSDLGQLLPKRGPLPVEEVLDYVTQVCEALAVAHTLGIVHRDLKPSNLMLVERSDGSSCIKVLDFGISKIVEGGDEALAMTKTSVVMGSPMYMSPEQMISARDVDARADIWSLGAILYELLTGVPPFVAESLAGLVIKVSNTKERPLGELRPGVPPELGAVVSRCLSKNREDRFANVGELGEALLPFAPPHARLSVERSFRILEGSGSTSSRKLGALREPSPAGVARSSQPGRPATPVPNSATHAGWAQTAAELHAKRRRLAAWAALGGVGLALVAGTIALVARSGTPEGVASPAVSAARPAVAQPLASPKETAEQPVVTPAQSAVVPPPAEERRPPETPVVPSVRPPASSTPRPSRAKHPAVTSHPPNPEPGPKPNSPKINAYDDM